MKLLTPQKKRTTVLRTIFRMTLGAFLLLAGISHLTVNREAFLAQVPTWLPIAGDFVVLASGVVEIVLGASLLALGRYRVQVGWIVAAFFVAIFPGNISQLATHTDSFGLNAYDPAGVKRELAGFTYFISGNNLNFKAAWSRINPNNSAVPSTNTYTLAFQLSYF